MKEYDKRKKVRKNNKLWLLAGATKYKLWLLAGATKYKLWLLAGATKYITVTCVFIVNGYTYGLNKRRALQHACC
jgi:hypothetical protein